VIYALLILALTQGDTIDRLDPNKGAYQAAVDACAEVEKLLEAKPEAALEKLVPVFKDIDKGIVKLVEQQINIAIRPQERTEYAFYPYHLRGRARLLAAGKRPEDEARRLLIDAVADLRTSVARKADRSTKFLASAEQELWDNVRTALAYDGGKAGAASLAEALALIAESPHASKASEWLAAEIGKVDVRVRGLRKTIPDLEARRAPASRAADWCDGVASSLKGLPAFKDPAAAIAATRALAVSIRDSRGTFRLKIGVVPWAKVEHLKRADEEIALDDRDTPLFIPHELEIDSYTVELVHPTKGRKNYRIEANSLLPGRTYVLWGDMAGDKFQVTELPK
jgi:hypothetical protein